MQAKRKHLSLLSIVVVYILFSTSLLTWNGLSHAIARNTTFYAHLMQVNPIVHEIPYTQPGNMPASNKAVQFPCQSSSPPQEMFCYGPYQVRQAYGVTDLLAKNINGQGSTITVIDAGGSPTIRQDLHAFDTQWGLPDPAFNVLTPDGIQESDGSWRPEVSVDVEWAHVMAPAAALNLVVARSSSDVDLYNVLKYVVDHNLGDVISLSFGENETCADSKLRHSLHQVLADAEQKRMTVLVATGDFGSAQYTCNNANFQQAVSFPADDPLVTAVGGTTLKADPLSGQYRSETAWNESTTFNKASGGGFSIYDDRPAYQNGVVSQSSGRAVPDLSMNASINGGVLIYQSQEAAKNPPVTVIGGTSVSTPELAGLLADGMQMAGHRLGLLNPALYQLGLSKKYPQLMNDVTSGNNILLTFNISGYSARLGWDPVTGWGSPKQAEPFLRALLNLPDNAQPAPPTTTPVSTPPTTTSVNAPPTVTPPVKEPVNAPPPAVSPTKSPTGTPPPAPPEKVPVNVQPSVTPPTKAPVKAPPVSPPKITAT